MPAAPARKRSTRLLSILFLAAFAVVCARGIWIVAHMVHEAIVVDDWLARGTQERWTSRLLGHETSIAYRRIEPVVVTATVSGRLMECNVDTGVANVVWPDWLDIPSDSFDDAGHPDHGTYEIYGIWGKSYRQCIESVSLGGLTLGPIAGYVIVPDNPSARPHEKVPTDMGDAVRPRLQLGNDTFRSTVVTFDWAERTIILHDRTWDPAQHMKPGSTVLPVTWIRGDPTVRGTVDGHPACMLIDSCGTLSVSGDFQARYLKGRHVYSRTVYTPFGETTDRWFDQMAFALGPIHKTARPWLEPTPIGQAHSGIDAIVGPFFLGSKTMTIDYPRSRLILAP